MSAKVSVVILTHNEALHLSRAIRSVLPFAQQVIVVDSGSTDETVQIAISNGAEVMYHEFVSHARQFQWAIDNASISGDWVMRLDADEIVEKDLCEEIKGRLEGLPPSISGIVLKRKHIFLGKWIKWGGRYPVMMLRIWRRGCARVEDRWMDEHIVLLSGRAITFSGSFADWNLKPLAAFVEKHNQYATREAVELVNAKYRLWASDDVLTVANTSLRVATTRAAKLKFYNRLPFPFAAALYGFYRLFLRLGVLDGIEGLVYHVLQGFWYRFLVGAKVLEIERALVGVADRRAAKHVIARLTGLKLD